MSCMKLATGRLPGGAEGLVDLAPAELVTPATDAPLVPNPPRTPQRFARWWTLWRRPWPTPGTTLPWW